MKSNATLKQFIKIFCSKQVLLTWKNPLKNYASMDFSLKDTSEIYWCCLYSKYYDRLIKYPYGTQVEDSHTIAIEWETSLIILRCVLKKVWSH